MPERLKVWVANEIGLLFIVIKFLGMIFENEKERMEFDIQKGLVEYAEKLVSTIIKMEALKADQIMTRPIYDELKKIFIDRETQDWKMKQHFGLFEQKDKN